MELETDNVTRNPFHDFCRSFIDVHAKDWPPSEEQLVEKFVRFFGLDPLPYQSQLQQLASQLGIELSAASLPEELAGIHFRYGQVGVIIVSNKDPYLLSTEQTILHELREMLEDTFRALGYPTSSDASLEERAETFAVEVRLWGVMEFWYPLIERATEQQSWWRKAGLFALISLGAMTYTLSCVMVPLLEKFKLNGRRQSEITFQHGTPPVIKPSTEISARH